MNDMRGRIQHAGEEFSAGWFKRLADYLGTTPDELNEAIRSGQALLEPGWAEKMAGYIGVDIRWLISGVGVPRPAGTAPALEKSDVNTSKQQRSQEQQAFMERLQQNKASAQELTDHMREVLESNFMQVVFAFNFGLHGAGNDLNDDTVGYVEIDGFNESAMAAIVVGDKWGPRYENGEFLVVEEVSVDDRSVNPSLEKDDEVIVRNSDRHLLNNEYFEFRAGRVLIGTNDYVAVGYQDGKGSGNEQAIYFESEPNYRIYKVLAKFPKNTFFVKEDMIESNPIGVMTKVAQRLMPQNQTFEEIVLKGKD